MLLYGLIFYLALMLAVGLATMRLNRTGEDYLLAGRRLNTWVATFSERASGESAWLLLGLPAMVLTTGLVEIWAVIGCVAGIGLSWWVVAGPLRRESARLDALTLPELFVRRFGVWGVRIRLTGTTIVLFFFACYLSAQLNGAGKVLNTTFPVIDHFWGMVLGAVVIVAYTVLGGFFAVAWTDLIQGILMLGTLVILPLVAWVEIQARGVDLGAALAAAPPGVSSLVQGRTGWAAVAAVVGGLAWGLGYLGQPHVVIRYMAIRSPEAVRAGRFIALGWAILGFGGAFLLGLLSHGLVAPADLGPDPERLMPYLATSLLHPLLAGVFICGAVAAMMSTADSQLLVTTSAVAEDVVHRTLRPGLTHRQMVRISRATTLVVGALAFLLAWASPALIYNMVSYAWAGLGSAFGPALVLTLHWRRTTAPGVLAGMVVGAGSTVLWVAAGLDRHLTERLASFLLAFLAIMVVSLATAPRVPKKDDLP